MEKVNAKEKDEALTKSFAKVKEAVTKAETAKEPASKGVKTTETTTAKKTPAKKAVAAETAKKAEDAPKKTAAKKAPVKKAATKKTAEPKTAVTFEFNGKQLLAKEILDKAMKAFKETNKDTEIKSFELYIVAHENAAYYVVNGTGADEYKIEL